MHVNKGRWVIKSILLNEGSFFVTKKKLLHKLQYLVLQLQLIAMSPNLKDKDVADHCLCDKHALFLHQRFICTRKSTEPQRILVVLRVLWKYPQSENSLQVILVRGWRVKHTTIPTGKSGEDLPEGLKLYC